MLNHHSARVSGISSKSPSATDDIQTKSASVPRILPGFGIWQLTASFHFPSTVQSALCCDDLSRQVRSKLHRHTETLPSHSSKDQKKVFKLLAEAEGRLRLVFASDELFSFLPLQSDLSSAEQLSPSLRRQSFRLQSTEPFEWLSSPMSTSSTFRNLGSSTFFNDFLMRPTSPGETNYSKALDTAQFNVAAMLADRRSHMLAQGQADRTYNIYLPPAMIYEGGNPSRAYVLVPSLSFIRLSNTNSFRRTFSLSLVLIPVSQDTNAARALDPDEPAALHTEWTLIPSPGIASYFVSYGGLTAFVAREAEPWDRSGKVTVTLRELIQDILFAVVSNAVRSDLELRGEALRDYLHDLVVRAVQASVCGGYCSVLPDVSVSELRHWQTSPTEERTTGAKLSVAFAKIMGPQLTNEWAMEEPSSFRLRHGRGAEPLIPTFYFSFALQRLLFTPSAADLESQDTSLLWTVGWHLLLMTGISALLEMLGTFHHEMEHRSTATSAQAFLKEFLVDIEEYFDFDLLPVYRLDFDALKKVEGIDNDFERLRERVASLGQERIIEESRKTNQRLLWIAAASFLVSAALLILAFKPSEAPRPSQVESTGPSRQFTTPQAVPADKLLRH